MQYNVTLWLIRLTIVAIETQQYFPFIVVGENVAINSVKVFIVAMVTQQLCCPATKHSVLLLTVICVMNVCVCIVNVCVCVCVCIVNVCVCLYCECVCVCVCIVDVCVCIVNVCVCVCVSVL